MTKAKKVFIRTFGCQMNEYDSDKMADVLRAAEGFEKTRDTAGGRRRHPLQHLLGAREGAGEGVRRPRPRAAPEARATRPDDRRRRLRGEPGRRRDRAARALRRRGVRAADAAPAAAAARRSAARRAEPQVDISFPEIEKFDHLPPRAGRGRARAFVSIMEGCSKYCSFCVVPYTRGEEVSRPFDDVLTEVRRPRRPGREGSDAARPERECLPRRASTTASAADFATAARTCREIAGIERIRYTTSHPREFTQRLIDAYAKLPKLVPHVHLPVQSGSDRVLAAMKRGYTALEYRSIIRRLRHARPGHLDLTSRLHRRLSRRDRGRFRGDDEARRRRRLRRLVQLHLQPAARHAGGEPRGRHAARGEARAPAAPAGAPARALARVLAAPWSAPASACWSRARRRKDAARARRPHRQQPRGEFRRPPAARSAASSISRSATRYPHSLRGRARRGPARRDPLNLKVQREGAS